MKKTGLIIFTVVLLCFNLISCSSDDTKGNKVDLSVYLDPDYWKRQALEDIIPFWEKTADKKGGFFTDIMIDGKINLNTGKYPRMQSRAVYGFSVAYLLSGDDKYLEYARHGLDYLTNYGWDSKNGGWYQFIETNNIASTFYEKNLFDEVYGNLGPALYYFVTHDKKALYYVGKTHELMQKKAWDFENAGYFAEVNREWEKTTVNKSFNAELDTCSAYLIYYYLSTKKTQLLEDLTNIANVVVTHMINPKTGFVGELFNEEWKSIDPWLWVGHNLKTAWVLMRIYNLTGEKKYLEAAQRIAAIQLKNNWDSRYYGWLFQFREDDPSVTRDSKDWWTQTEGNFLMLNLYRLTSNPEYLQRFQECSFFWDNYMIDHKYKECYPTVSRNGQVVRTQKGNLYKSAYHTMEHALFNYLYLSFYVQKKDAEIYLNVSCEKAGDKQFVRLVEDTNVIIKKVEINGEDWKDFNANEGSISLPAGNNMKIRVVLGPGKL